MVMVLRYSFYSRLYWRGVSVADELDYDIVVSDFKLQSHYYVHFRTNTQKKGTNSLIPPPVKG